MKKTLIIFALAVFAACVFIAFGAGSALAGPIGEVPGAVYGPGPAPCSGDGIPDGPGWENPCQE